MAIIVSRNGYAINPQKPLGRQSAGESFLNAYFSYSRNTTHNIIVPKRDEAKWFHEQARRYDPKAITIVSGMKDWGDAAAKSGTIHLPDPGINKWAWKRMPWGDGAFSLIGIVHTLCSYTVQNNLGGLPTSPTRHWDALICTSKAAKGVVEGFLDRQETWLRHKNNACKFERPQLPVIPLAIDPGKWSPRGERREIRNRARKELGIRHDAKIILLAGRLDIWTKFQPSPLFRAIESMQNSHPNLEIIIYGEAPNEQMQTLWEKATKQIAPSTKIHWVPGRNIEQEKNVRWAADIFVSLSDNPQETFGITPLEAMAAELPCIVSDWDGYRESVVQPGEGARPTGFRITTRLVQGLGHEEARAMLSETMDYPEAAGRVAQGIAVDMKEFKKLLKTLLDDESLQFRMGENGRRRVEAEYNWVKVIEHWRDLVFDLNERRSHAVSKGIAIPPQLPPWMPDTSIGYGCFATEIIQSDWNPNPPERHIEKEMHGNLFQSWDTKLLKKTDARRKGWWLKQGIADYQ